MSHCCGSKYEGTSSPLPLSEEAARRKVVVFSGHMTDAADRPEPRFPEGNEGAVRLALDQALEHWEVGPLDRCFCGGARGGDLLFAEACLRKDADVQLLLALPPDAFNARSVRLPGTDWEERFRAVLAMSTVRLLDEADECAGHSIELFARLNDCLVDQAVAAARPNQPYVLLLWDGRQSAPGKPGTADFAEKAQRITATPIVIDPRSPLDWRLSN